MAIEIGPDKGQTQAKTSRIEIAKADLKKEIKDYSRLTADQVEAANVPTGSLTRRAAKAALVSEKRGEAKVVAFKARYTKWVADGEPANEILDTPMLAFAEPEPDIGVAP